MFTNAADVAYVTLRVCVLYDAVLHGLWWCSAWLRAVLEKCNYQMQKSVGNFIIPVWAGKSYDTVPLNMAGL